MTTAETLLPALAAASADPIPAGEPGGDWGSALVYRQQQIIDAAGGTRQHRGGFVFPDGSLLRVRSAKWVDDKPDWEAVAPADASAILSGVKPNTLGLVKHMEVELGGRQLSLTQQLDRAGVAYEEVEVPTLRGWAGNASLVLYVSPNSRREITALVIPRNPNGDDPTEEVFTFDLPHAEGRARDWMGLWDELRGLVR